MEFKNVSAQLAQLRTLRELLEQSVDQFADHSALILRGEQPLTYGDVDASVRRIRGVLASHGVEPGARVALLADNKPLWGIVYLAVTTMGAVVVPILPDFSPNEVNTIVEHSGAVLVVISESLRSKVEGRQNAPNVLILEELDAPGSEQTGSSDQPADPETTPDENDLAAILYTSGTTGRPKGVMLTHRNLVQNVISSRSVVEIGTNDRFLSILPLAHSYECTIGFLVPLASGASITYLGKPPALSVLLPALQEVHPTMMLSVPLIMEKLHQSRVKPVFTRNVLMRVAERIGPVRRIIHRAAGRKVYEAFGGALHFYGIGGAPLSAPVERFLREAHFPYSIGYGLTETSPLVAGTDAEHTRFRSTGPAIRGVEIRIDPDADNPDEGELQVRGPNVMQGYYRNQEATNEVLLEDGWFRTGDLVARDQDGYLYIRGRLKNMIVGPSGENIYPGDIEAIINEHELVEASIVFEWEGRLIARVHVDTERIKAEMGDDAAELTTIQPRADEVLEEVRTAVNARVNRHSRLSRIILQWEPFETTPTRKIKRFLYTHLGGHE